MKKRYTCILQHDTMDCGAACIAMISKYYGLKIPIGKIRQYASTNLVGTNVLGLKEAGEKLKFDVKAVRGEEKDFNKKLQTPFIAHVNKDGLLHYVVVYKITKDKVIVADPAEGLLKQKKDDFFKQWTGIIVFMKPSTEFEEGNEKKGIFERFFKYIKPNKGLITHIIVATLIYTFLGLLGAFYFKYLIDDILANHLKNTLITFTGGLIILKIFQLILGTFRSYIIFYLGQKINSGVMLDYYKHVMNLPLSFFENRKIGEITSRISDGSSVMGALTNTIFTVVIDSVMIFAVGGILLSQNIKLFVMALMFIPLYTITILIFIKPFRKYHRKVMESHSQLESYLVESLNGVPTIKALGGEKESLKTYEEKFLRLLKDSFTNEKIGMTSDFIESILNIFSGNFIYFIGGLEVIKGNISIGQLLTFNTLYGLFFGSVRNFVDLIPITQKAHVASDRLGEVLDIEIEKQTGIDKENIKGTLEFKNIDFKYGNGKNVLTNINFKISSGETLAIIGESGSGKSTLIKLLMRYYETINGEITIDNHNIKENNLKSFRERIAYVPQETFLFSGTIMENLKFGFLDKSDDEVIEACRKACIDEFIEKDPLKYSMRISERGSNLSGGQRQRISLARAFLKDSDILILDEATSSLDVETEEKINKGISEYSKGKMIILVAHKLATIKKADKIIVLSSGKITETGTHRELLKIESGIYKRFWDLQVGAADE